MDMPLEDLERLTADAPGARARMPESAFVRRLLPYLVPSESADDTVRAVDIFAAAAGNPMRMIDVVSDTANGEVLFTVPPMVSPTPTSIRTENSPYETDIGAIADQFEAEISISHPSAVIDAFVARMLALNISPTEAMTMLYARMWAVIYRRYNIPLPRLLGEKAAIFENTDPVSPPSGQKEDSTSRKLDEIGDDLEPF